MGETTKTLPELFREAQTISPGFAKASWFVDFDDDCPDAWRVGRQCVSVEDASTIIVGACVAMLEDYWWEKIDDEFLVTDGMGSLFVAPALSQALLLAVLAQHERSGT